MSEKGFTFPVTCRENLAPELIVIRDFGFKADFRLGITSAIVG